MLRGSCLCGTVRYEVREAPRTMYLCHCGMCRKASGSSFATNMLVARSGFVIVSGRPSLKGYPSSPGEQRHFCGQCGSPIYSQSELRPDVVSVRCGTLDDDPGIEPSEHIYVGSKAAWFAIPDGARQFECEPDS